MSVFTNAKKKATSKATKERVEFALPEDKSSAIAKYIDLKKQIDILSGEKDVNEKLIKDCAFDLFCAEYEESGKRPDNFNVIDNEGNTLQFIVQDKYKKIGLDDYVNLAERYGDDIVEDTSIFGFDSKILNKHQQTISNALENCNNTALIDSIIEEITKLDKSKKFASVIEKIEKLRTESIPESDLENLLFKQETYVVAKGAIDNIPNYCEFFNKKNKKSNMSLKSMVEEINPIQALKVVAKK